MDYPGDLLDGFDYDLWANLLWRECLGRKGIEGPDRLIFDHILSASATWLYRCQGECPTEPPPIDSTEEAMTSLNNAWKIILRETTENRVVEYRRYNGEPLSAPVREIVLHVLNHGTYHRGELRGLCLARGDNDFPETDRMLFSLTKLRS